MDSLIYEWRQIMQSIKKKQQLIYEITVPKFVQEIFFQISSTLQLFITLVIDTILEGLLWKSVDKDVHMRKFCFLIARGY